MKNNGIFRILFTKFSQFHAFYDFNSSDPQFCETIDRIYIDSDMAMSCAPEILAMQKELSQKHPKLSWYLSLPAVLREGDGTFLDNIRQFLSENPCFQGLLCGNLEGIGYFLSSSSPNSLIADHNFYLWNKESVKAWCDKLSGACFPLELNAGEQKDLLKACKDIPGLFKSQEAESQNPFLAWDKIIYGYLPLMFTANCVAKTLDGCRKGKKEGESGLFFLKDRTGTDFPVSLNCEHCFNTIYNSVPLSLHAQLEKWQGQVAFRMQFTIEDEAKTKEILSYFLTPAAKNKKIPFAAYTNGHEKRGVT